VPLHRLAVSPADVCGSGLGLALNAPGPPPLATLSLVHPEHGELTLGVLGASHVITVAHPDSLFSEEISCTARGHGDALPATAQAAGYHLQSHTEQHDETSFRDIASTLRQRCAQQDDWLGGTFPGDDAALTALSAEPDGAGWRWRTWHLYPSHYGGEVVHTISRWQP
jgi:Protein of unknown function DUF2617